MLDSSILLFARFLASHYFLKLRFQPDLRTGSSQHLAIKASWPGALLLPNAAALFGSD